MKRNTLTIYTLLLLCLAFTLTGCVHEFPDLPDRVPFRLRLHYETDMTEWNHRYAGQQTTDEGLGATYDNCLPDGVIRYTVRAYPSADKRRAAQDCVREFVFTKDIAEGYDHEATLDLAPGDYDIMVWSDLVRDEGDAGFHDTGDFAAISLQGEHRGNEDCRDAFRGTATVSLTADIAERIPATLDIAMQRPLAKYEFVTTDLTEFLLKEQIRAEEKAAARSTGGGEEAATRVNLEDYRVVFYYVGFMPCTYSMFTDKPVDSKTGVLFESRLKRLNQTEASVGFDYVFINGAESAVTVQIALYDDEGTQLSLTEPIAIPLKRSRHSIMRGSFLMTEASGGVSIDPGFDGDYNLVFP